MTVLIRNVVTPIYGSDAVAQFLPWLYREALLMAGWTEVANNGDAAWASNVIATLSDFYVDPADPYLVKTAAGNVSAHSGRILSLRDPTNEANCVVANIKRVVDSSTLYLDERNLAKPWVTASGLTGRIHIGGQTALLATSAWSVLQAPGGGTPFQVRFKVSATANSCEFDCLPLGDYSGAKTYTAAYTQTYTQRRALRMNAQVDGKNFLIWGCTLSSAGALGDYYIGIGGGELTNCAPTDTLPRFMTEMFAATSFSPWVSRGLGFDVRMLSHLSTQVSGYVATPKSWDNASHGDSWGLLSDGGKLWSRAKRITVTPWVYAADVATIGGYPRGKFPFSYVNTYWTDWRRLDAAATQRASAGALLLTHGGLSGCDIFDPVLAI